MATKTTQQTPTDDEYEQMFADWVYTIPGLLLMVLGFGGLVFMTLA